jgi:hypothetical protein
MRVCVCMYIYTHRYKIYTAKKCIITQLAIYSWKLFPVVGLKTLLQILLQTHVQISIVKPRIKVLTFVDGHHIYSRYFIIYVRLQLVDNQLNIYTQLDVPPYLRKSKRVRLKTTSCNAIVRLLYRVRKIVFRTSPSYM